MVINLERYTMSWSKIQEEEIKGVWKYVMRGEGNSKWDVNLLQQNREKNPR